MARRHRTARVHRRGLAAVVAATVVSVAAATAEATGPTTITFSEHPAGTVIDAEYGAQGVRFGTTAELGAPSLSGAWNCGAPQVKDLTSDGVAPQLAQAPLCGGRSGTVAAFSGPRKSIRLVVEVTPRTTRQAEVLAYGANGTLLTSARAATNGSVVSIDRPSPDIVYLALQLTGEGTSALLFDDLAFDHLGDLLTLSARGVAATVGVERTDNVARLTDADPTATEADYAVTIEWGDGQSSAGRLARSGDGYDVVGTHTYSTTGTFSLRATVRKANGVEVSATSTARVVDRPDFSVVVTPSTATVSQGATSRFTVSVTPLAGFTGSVALTASGAPGTFDPAPLSVPGTSQLAVTTAATAPGTYSVTVTATGGSVSRSASATLVVTKAAPGVTAKLAAPRRAAALSLIALDARGSTGVSRYLWDVTGDRRPDVECGGATPVLGMRSRTLGRRSVSVTAVSASGSAAVARQTLAVVPRVGRRTNAAGAASTEVATCLRDARAYAEGRACAEKVVFGLVEAQGCFAYAVSRDDVPRAERAAFDAYRGDPALRDPLVARGPIKVNGISFVPSGGAAIVLFPQLARVVSSRAEISLGGIRVRSAGAVNLALARSISGLPLGKRSARARLLRFATTTPLAALGGFQPTGEAELSLVKLGSRHFSETKISLALPRVFSLFGQAPTGATRLQADNTRGLVLDELSLRVPEAHLGTIRMTDLAFEYRARGNTAFNCPRRWWKATAAVYLGSTDRDAGFRLAPDPPQNGIAFCNGAFKSAGGEVVFGAQIPPPQLFPGVYLTRIGFAVALDPTLLIGTGTVTSGGLFDVSGRLFMAFPSISSPYVVRTGDVGPELGVLAGRRLVTTTVALGGTFKLRVPLLGSIPFANAYVAYSYPDYVALGGAVRIPAPGFAINAGITGEMAVGRGLFDFHGYAEACIAGLACLVRADAWVTSTGVVVCGSIAGELHPGAGYRWGDAWPTIWLVDGCKPSRYWVNVRQRTLGQRPLQETATTTFTVARGERTKNVRLAGVGGAPTIEVRGPTGEVVSTTAGVFARGRTIRILRQDGGKVTWIGVENATPGSYTVTSLPGSPPIAGLAATRPQDDRIRAMVARVERARVLRYDVASVPGRRVTFVERGGTTFRPLGSTAGGRGVIRLPSGRGTAGPRQIVAQVRLDGVPAPDRIVARYRADGPSRIGRPSRMQLRRRGSTVVVSWHAAPNAERYVVVVRLGSGAQRVLRVAGASRSVRLGAVPATQSGTVTVRGITRWSAPGPASIRRFHALRVVSSPFRPFAELRREARR